ncbi:MAG: hypothetical protein V5A44_07445 [Haloarculaceae archaeon]
MDVAERVHLMPVGYENDRIVLSAERLRAERDAANRKSEYRLLDSHVLDPLVDNGYVELEEVGRSTRVSLTGSGANTLRAFRYLVEE